MSGAVAHDTFRIRIIRLPEVCQLTGLGKTTIYELVAEEAFPASVKITSYAVGWIESEVQAWLARRIEASRSAVHLS